MAPKTVTEPVAAITLNDKPDKIHPLDFILNPALVEWSDGSQVNPKGPDAQTTFASLLESANDWTEAVDRETTASKVGGILIMQLRESSLRANGLPDWSGKTNLSVNLVGERLKQALTLDPKFGGKGWSETRYNRWKNRVAVAMSTNRIPLAYVADYCCRTDRKLATAKMPDGKTSIGMFAKQLLKDAQSSKSAPNVDLPPELVAAIDVQFNAQRAKGTGDNVGDRLPGFEAVPAQAGTKPSASNANATAEQKQARQRDSYNAKIKQTASQIEKGSSAGVVTTVQALTDAHRILTAALDRAIGKPSDTEDPKHGRDGKAVATLVEQLYKLASEANSYLNDASDDKSRDQYAMFRWTNSESK